MKPINILVEKWINKNIQNPNNFFKKLLIHWNKIVGPEIAKYSIPHNFITQNNQNILIIYVYNGAISVKMQSMLEKIKNQILINIGYSPVKEIKIIQKNILY